MGPTSLDLVPLGDGYRLGNRRECRSFNRDELPVCVSKLEADASGSITDAGAADTVHGESVFSPHELQLLGHSFTDEGRVTALVKHDVHSGGGAIGADSF